MPKVCFIEKDGSEVIVEVPVGFSILDAARQNNVKLDGPCGGNLVCGLCDIIIDEKFYDKLPAPSEDEEDMLDLVPNCCKTSRLSCQVKMTDALDGIKIKL